MEGVDKVQLLSLKRDLQDQSWSLRDKLLRIADFKVPDPLKDFTGINSNDNGA